MIVKWIAPINVAFESSRHDLYLTLPLLEHVRNIDRRDPLYDQLYDKTVFRHNFLHTPVEIGCLHPPEKRHTKNRQLAQSVQQAKDLRYDQL